MSIRGKSNYTTTTGSDTTVIKDPNINITVGCYKILKNIEP